MNGLAVLQSVGQDIYGTQGRSLGRAERVDNEQGGGMGFGGSIAWIERALRMGGGCMLRWRTIGRRPARTPMRGCSRRPGALGMTSRGPVARGVVVAALLWLAPTAFAPAWGQGLPGSVTRQLAKGKIPSSAVSVFVQEVTADKPLLAVHADTPRNPASTMKLLTTFAGLDALGPAYTWDTRVYVAGDVRDGVVHGDLVIRGHGDPFLVPEFLWRLVRGLREKGLHRIRGDVVIDNGYFQPEPELNRPLDGKVYRAYNASADALLINFQSVRFRFVPDKERKRVRIATFPEFSNLKVVNRLRYVEKACGNRLSRIRMQVDRQPEATTVTFKGDYPVRCGEWSIVRVVMEPQAAIYGAFRSLWEETGGRLDGGMQLGSVPDGAIRILDLESRPIAEIIRGVNKFSNNVMARQVFLTLGAELQGEPGTYAKARAAVSQWLKKKGLSFPELVVDNGSGLSRNARISARNMGTLLLAAYRSPLMPEFVSSLPIVGVDGTMRKRMKKTPVSGRAHIKTGTLRDASAIAGYVKAKSGKDHVVVVFLNHKRAKGYRARAVHDALVQWVYAH